MVFHVAIKDLLPTAPVLKAGRPVSCSSLCMLGVVCLVCIVWLVEVRFLGFFLSITFWLVCYIFFHVCMYVGRVG